MTTEQPAEPRTVLGWLQDQQGILKPDDEGAAGPRPAEGRPAEPIALSGDVSNSGEPTILLDAPYRTSITITGDSPLLFHRWQSDAVEAKAKAAKNSAAKKSDNV